MSETGPRMRDMEVAERIRRHTETSDEGVLLMVESLTHLLKTFSVVQDKLNRLLEQDGLTLAKFNLLIVLKNALDHQLQMSEIGERMSVTCANITKLVDGLERDGWVRRTNLPTDRRVVLTAMTPEGEELIQRVLRQHSDNVRHLWGDMAPDDCLHLIHLLMKLRHNALQGVPPDTLFQPR